jgi:hypothetical protein
MKEALRETGMDIGAVPTLIQPTLNHGAGTDEDVIIAPGVRLEPITNV